jgi:hypothetical protein
MKQLKELNISGCTVFGLGVREIVQHLPNLEVLRAASVLPSITGSDIIQIATSCPKLRILDIGTWHDLIDEDIQVHPTYY